MSTKFTKKYSILILEDDEVLNRNYERILCHRYHLKFVTNLEMLLEELEQMTVFNQPDLIICDLHLPDGFFNEFLVPHGELLQSKNVPVMVISLIDDLDMFNKLFKFGVCDFLLKNFSSNELLAKIDKAIRIGLQRRRFGGGDSALFHLEKKILDFYPALTKVEQRILGTMVFADNFEMQREDLVRKVWGESMVSSNTLAVHLSKMRRKMDHRVILDALPGGILRLELDETLL